MPAAAVAALGAGVLAGAGQAADGQSTKLAAALKRSMAATYHGYTFTRVTCTIPSATATSARCKAAFTKQQVKGVFHVAVTIDRSTGGVHWRATSVSPR